MQAFNAGRPGRTDIGERALIEVSEHSDHAGWRIHHPRPGLLEIEVVYFFRQVLAVPVVSKEVLT
jgi:hypothetical protein